MHIAGIYSSLDGTHFAASEGCFGIAKDDKPYSNLYVREVMAVISNQAKKDSHNRIKIIVVPRNPNEIPQAVM